VTTPTGQVAAPGRRLLAWFLDAAIVGLFATVLTPYRFSATPSRIAIVVWLGSAPLLSLVYLGLFDGGPKGATPGKRCVGLRVVDANSGGPIGYARAVLRRAAYFIGGLCLFIGWLWILGDPQRRTWHDRAAGTLVIRTRWM
jgi:uncharacterized RDD family membrane protein YckC